jgi:hypothetical protein
MRGAVRRRREAGSQERAQSCADGNPGRRARYRHRWLHLGCQPHGTMPFIIFDEPPGRRSGLNYLNRRENYAKSKWIVVD